MASVIVAGSLVPTFGNSFTVYPEPPKTIEEKILEELPPVFIPIAKAESGLKPEAYNPEWHYDSKGRPLCQGSFGVLQIACVHFENYEGNFDVDMNIELAKKIYEANGNSTRAWGVCKTINCNG